MGHDDDIERLRTQVRVLRVAIDTALDKRASRGVLESLTAQLLERQQRLAELDGQEGVARN